MYRLTLYVLLLVLVGCSRTLPHTTTLDQDRAKLAMLLNRYPPIQQRLPSEFASYLRDRLGTATRFQKSTGRASPEIIFVQADEPIALSIGSRYILVSSRMVALLPVEAELAFVVSHEMAHQWLGHPTGHGESYRLDASQRLERDADTTALGIMALAGYDPRVAEGALVQVYRALSPPAIDSHSHPDLNERIAGLHESLERSGWTPPGTVNRREYQRLRLALVSQRME